MSSVSQVKQAMQTIFRQVDALARQMGIVQIFVTAWLNNPQAMREAVAHMAASLGVSITARGLSDRCTEPAASLLQQMLDVVVSQVMAADPVAIPILQRFTAAILLDSTVIVLPDALVGVWRGCGGNTPERTQVAVMLQVSLYLLWGTLHGPHRSDGRAHDSGSTLQKAALNKKAFRLTDLGYFRLDVFAAHAQQEGYFLSWMEAATAVFDSEEQRLDLPTFYGSSKGRLLSGAATICGPFCAKCMPNSWRWCSSIGLCYWAVGRPRIGRWSRSLRRCGPLPRS